MVRSSGSEMQLWVIVLFGQGIQLTMAKSKHFMWMGNQKAILLAKLKESTL